MSEADHRHSDFEFWMPTGLVKSKSGDDKTKEKEWRLGGIASTGNPDLEGDSICQKGLDIWYLNSGWGVFNWNHEKGPDNLLGPIDYVEKSLDEGMWVEGYLWHHVEKARKVYDILKSVPEGEKSPLGFSIQGRVLQRRNGNITKSLVREVAITHCPVNQGSYTDLLKSYEDSFRCLDPEEDDCGCDACVAKSVDPGYQNPSVSGGNALRTEDLERSGKTKRRKRNTGPKVETFSLSLDEAVDYILKRKRGLSYTQAERVAKYVQRMSIGDM